LDRDAQLRCARCRVVVDVNSGGGRFALFGRRVETQSRGIDGATYAKILVSVPVLGGASAGGPANYPAGWEEQPTRDSCAL
jgi:hypothetical protein